MAQTVKLSKAQNIAMIRMAWSLEDKPAYAVVDDSKVRQNTIGALYRKGLIEWSNVGVNYNLTSEGIKWASNNISDFGVRYGVKKVETIASIIEDETEIASWRLSLRR